MMTLLLLLTTLASGADIAPVSMTPPVIVRAGSDQAAYYIVPAGRSVSFETPGPAKLSVESRQRLAGAGQRGQAAFLEARGDGHLIMTIEVPGTAVAKGSIDDALGGIPSKRERVTITVPGGGQQLSLSAPTGGPDFLVRVMDRGEATSAVPVATETPEEEATEEAAEEQAGVDEPVLAAAPEAERSRQDVADFSLRPSIGGTLGTGIAARGTKPLLHLAITGRYPVFRDLISVGGSIGWYRVGVEQTVQFSDPLMGTQDYRAQWHTDVIPIVVQGTFHAPIQLGPVVPMGGLGLGLYIATRTEGGESLTGPAIGPQIFAGADVDISYGRLVPTVSWNEARLRFGNPGPDGEVVRETLATTRLNLSYLYAF